MNKFIIIQLLFIGGLLFSCTCNNSNKGDEDDLEGDLTENLDSLKNKKGNTSYKIPSPMDMYIFLHNYNNVFYKEALNSLNNLNNYQTSASKAINFGVYASDLAYSATYNQYQETFKYFAAAKQLAGELGFEAGFNVLTSEQIEESFNNNDLLYQITTDAYWSAYNFLEENGQTKVLSLIIVGGWVESVHVAIKASGTFSEDNPVISRIAEQQFLLENLLSYLNEIEKDEDVQKITDMLMELQVIFDSLYDNKDVAITKQQFNQIADKIEIIRNELIG